MKEQPKPTAQPMIDRTSPHSDLCARVGEGSTHALRVHEDKEPTFEWDSDEWCDPV